MVKKIKTLFKNRSVMEEDALESADPGLPGPGKIAAVEPNAPAGALLLVAPLAQAMQRHAEACSSCCWAKGGAPCTSGSCSGWAGPMVNGHRCSSHDSAGADRGSPVIYPPLFARTAGAVIPQLLGGLRAKFNETTRSGERYRGCRTLILPAGRDQPAHHACLR